MEIMPGVFHPGLFFSTQLLLNYVRQFVLEDQEFLELGAGSGLIAIWAAKHGARVTATDISPTAVLALVRNAAANHVTLEIVLSDLFAGITTGHFDFILINPPYYPKDPETESDLAWYCGSRFEYFERLFLQLPAFMSAHTRVFMILSEDCALDQIRAITDKNGLAFTMIKQTRICWEMNYIFQINRLSS